VHTGRGKKGRGFSVADNKGPFGEKLQETESYIRRGKENWERKKEKVFRRRCRRRDELVKRGIGWGGIKRGIKG